MPNLSPVEGERAILEHVLRAFRRRVPEASGILLVDQTGHALAYDLVDSHDADALVKEAMASRKHHPNTGGVLLASSDGDVLVVFLPEGRLDEFPRAEPPEGVAA